MRSPGCTSSREMCGIEAYWAPDWCGRYTPACPHAYLVRPLQSKATPGDSAAKGSGAPSWLDAALTAMLAPDDTGGAGSGPRGAGAGAPPPPPLKLAAGAAPPPP